MKNILCKINAQSGCGFRNWWNIAANDKLVLFISTLVSFFKDWKHADIISYLISTPKIILNLRKKV